MKGVLIVKIRRQGNLSSKSVYKIQEDEREKIAGDIHDSVVQDLRAIRIKAEMLEINEAGKEKQNQLINDITLCITKMRDICYGLSPAELKIFDDRETADLYSIIQSLASQFTVKTNIPCSLQKSGFDDSLMIKKESCQNLVRIIQEALKNIEKHSFATQAQIIIKEEKENDEVRLYITDNGRGCDLKKIQGTRAAKNHFGLRMMKERAKIIPGCSVEFRSAINDGMQVKIKITGLKLEE